MGVGEGKVFGVSKVQIFLSFGGGFRLVIREVNQRLGEVDVSVNHFRSSNNIKIDYIEFEVQNLKRIQI